MDWGRLGSVVTAERARRGYRSRAAFADASGLSLSTLDNIEHGRKTSYDPGTIAALEGALRWKTGAVERILKGLDPIPSVDPELDALIAAWPKLSPGARRILVVLAVEGARAENN